MLSFLFLMVLTSSAKEKIEVVNPEKQKIEKTEHSEQYGILGKWKFGALTIDGVTDIYLTINQDFIEFIKDNNLEDHNGEFLSTRSGYEVSGLFELEADNSAIHIYYGHIHKLYKLQITGNLMTFSYSQNNQDIVENWYRIE